MTLRPLIYSGEHLVAARLALLDLNEDLLQEVIAYGMRYVLECTENDPAGTAGYLAWAKINRALRDKLLPRGWTKNNDQNYPRTAHPSRGFSIAVVGGDVSTGIENLTPSNRTEK